jgi:hypothetical protein
MRTYRASQLHHFDRPIARAFEAPGAIYADDQLRSPGEDACAPAPIAELIPDIAPTNAGYGAINPPERR